VMVTHDADLAARTRRTVHMVDGRILDGTLDPDGPSATRPVAEPRPTPPSEAFADA
jgi:ABC-type lipoprotein export system ATPase subunit